MKFDKKVDVCLLILFVNNMAIAMNRRYAPPLSNWCTVEWAPFDTPLSRRLQTFAALAFISYIMLGHGVVLMMYLKLLYSRLWWLALLYAAWMILDIDSCDRGGRKWDWVRNWAWWRYFRDYFPIKLVKTAELDPTKNYLFACFPHGLVCCGAFSSFWTNAQSFYHLFPGMTVTGITLKGHFLFPLYRELLLFLGACSASQQSLLYLLNPRNFAGKCVALIVGGAAEALDSHPGEYKVILSRRKGFIRIAMMSGASLVPVFSFGEPDVFRPPRHGAASVTRRIQEWVRRVTGVSPILPLGRGVFQYSVGVVPLRAPITTVVGKPMDVSKNLDPTDEEVDIVHQEFQTRLIELFETEKSKYIKDHERTTLVIL